jgi:dihydrofolate synthase/folylpolyglutamate synthase
MPAAPEADKILARLLSLHPKKIDLNLDRMWRILALIGNPQQQLPAVIHIAGTNGKGSTLAFLRALGAASGLRTHAYISPHLVRFNERIELAGQAIDDGALEEVLKRCEQANAGAPITFFEITTAAALLAFSETPGDLLILETGLGGRLDSTNVVATPAVSVITPISIDHQHFLGQELQDIAYAKAGILRSGVPAVIAPQPAAAMEVIVDQAERLGTPLYLQDRDWTAEFHATGLTFSWRGQNHTPQEYQLPAPSLIGAHQAINAGCALAALHAFEDHRPAERVGFKLDPSSLAAGLTNARWPARLQALTAGPLLACLNAPSDLWLDGGHNAGGAAVIGAHIKTWQQSQPERPIALIYGSLNSHDPKAFFTALDVPVAAIRTVTIPEQENALTGTEIAAQLSAMDLAVDTSPSVTEAVHNLQTQFPEGVRILIAGSLYLAGYILATHH